MNIWFYESERVNFTPMFSGEKYNKEKFKFNYYCLECHKKYLGNSVIDLPENCNSDSCQEKHEKLKKKRDALAKYSVGDCGIDSLSKIFKHSR